MERLPGSRSRKMKDRSSSALSESSIWAGVRDECALPSASMWAMPLAGMGRLETAAWRRISSVALGCGEGSAEAGAGIPTLTRGAGGRANVDDAKTRKLARTGKLRGLAEAWARTISRSSLSRMSREPNVMASSMASVGAAILRLRPLFVASSWSFFVTAGRRPLPPRSNASRNSSMRGWPPMMRRTFAVSFASSAYRPGRRSNSLRTCACVSGPMGMRRMDSPMPGIG